jgi:hypothetical protein
MNQENPIGLHRAQYLQGFSYLPTPGLHDFRCRVYTLLVVDIQKAQQ